MVLLSIILHLAGFSMILFVPEPSPTHAIRDSVYEVSLVEIPSKPGPPSAPSKEKIRRAPKDKTPEEKPTPTKRIAKVEWEGKAVSIAKKTIKLKDQKSEKPDISRSKLLEKALSNIKKKEETISDKNTEKKSEAPDKKDELEEAISRITSRVEKRSEGTSGGGGPRTGLIMQLYKLEIEAHVRSHWSYPTLLTPKAGESPKAVVVLEVRNDGTVLNFRFKERSSNEIFNQSVLKAIKQSDPLPPFPEGYRKTKDEIVITFDLDKLV